MVLGDKEHVLYGKGYIEDELCGLRSVSYTHLADYLQTFKAAVKRIAKRHGLHATFMPKPNMSGDGSGLHVGVSISSRRGAEAMAQAKQIAAGVLKNLSDMMIFTNPTVNSYKRLAAAVSYTHLT